jgi:formylmethanofuran dehydrogenase subunit E
MKKMENEIRKDIEKILLKDDLEGLLKKTGELHGHYRSHLSYGLRAGHYALKNLGSDNIGIEEVITIIETKACAFHVQMRVIWN